jgi:hypothetical protein
MVHRIEILNTNPASRRTIPRMIMMGANFRLSCSGLEVGGLPGQRLTMRFTSTLLLRVAAGGVEVSRWAQKVDAWPAAVGPQGQRSGSSLSSLLWTRHVGR